MLQEAHFKPGRCSEIKPSAYDSEKIKLSTTRYITAEEE